ncbi:MAG: YhgE/Pip family protein, partial [Bifidobacteriaceae bacterium]|nr:YhgE/Pip family protein [Bifidobacteriaceae bacterium]
MATTFTVAFKGLKNTLKTSFMRVAIAALILIPSIYTGFYLWANYDPYTLMKNVPVAISCEDKLVKVGNNTFDLGKTVENELINQQAFDMQKTDSKSLREGVYNGRYMFGIIIPADFSKQVSTLYSSIISTNSKTSQAQHSQIILVSNDANNYIIDTAAKQLSNKLQASINSQVMREFSDNLLKGLNEIHNNLSQASAASEQLAGGIEELEENSKKIKAGLEQLDEASKPLPSIMDQLANGSKTLADGNAKIAEVANKVKSIALILDSDWNNKTKPKLIEMINSLPITEQAKQFLLDQVNFVNSDIEKVYKSIDLDVSQINQLSAGAEQLSSSLKEISEKVPQLVSAINQLSTGYNDFDEGINKIQAASKEFSQQLKLGLEKVPQFSDSQRNNINDVIANPVSMQNEKQSESPNYGVGLAPFFISLSTWVGAYALFVLFKPFKNAELTFSNSDFRAGLGSYFIPALFGCLQMICLYITVVFILQVPVAHHWMLLAYMLLVSATFVAIMFCLAALLNLAGLYIGLILLILQITSCGGTFPYQTTPEFFQVLHHIMPMSYSVDSIRHIIN